MTEQQNPDMHQMAQQDPSQRVQDAMLRMATNLTQQGHVHEATDMYFQLLQTYPGTEGARAAANALVDLGKYMEENGMPHMAMHLYRRLEELQ
jgi:hypothetical protein